MAMMNSSYLFGEGATVKVIITTPRGEIFEFNGRADVRSKVEIEHETHGHSYPYDQMIIGPPRMRLEASFTEGTYTHAPKKKTKDKVRRIRSDRGKHAINRRKPGKRVAKKRTQVARGRKRANHRNR